MNNISISKIITVISFVVLVNTVFSQSAFNNKTNITSYELSSKKERIAYEYKVKSKLEDFYNYLQIIGNPKVEKQLREHTVTLTQKLFSDDVEMINLLSESDTTILLSTFLQKLLYSNQAISFSLSEITPRFNNEGENISYHLQVKAQDNTKTFDLNQRFTLSLLNKKFGSKTKQVTVITLGRIY